MPSTPTNFTTSLYANEGCASVADASGNLLFYTAGTDVYNSNHAVMANGSGMYGYYSAIQSCLIVKQPQSSNLYYIFTNNTCNGNSGLYYSVVNMSLAAGQGSVVVKNVPVTPSALSLTEQLAATRHCNGVDTWIVVHDAICSYTAPPTTDFYAYLVTSAGVNTVAVISTAGTVGINNASLQSCIKISPNGKKLASASSTGGLHLFDFDNATGVVSNSVLIKSLSAYGCEFSPDNRFLYGDFKSNGLAQFDLCAGSPSAIAASEFSVGPGFTSGFSMQIAKNKKIYYANRAINNPNIYGSGCNYVTNGFTFTTNILGAGLPNFDNSVFNEVTSPPFTYTISHLPVCMTASFTAPSAQLLATCAYGNYSLASVSWNFGDPGSGTSNTSSLMNPVHVYPAAGTYTAQVLLYNPCGGLIDTVKQPVVITSPSLNIVTSSVTCASLGTATVSVNYAAPFSYTWLPGGQTGSAVSSIVPGTQSIIAQGPSGACSFTSGVYFAPIIPLTGSLNHTGTLSCNGASTGTAGYSNLAGGSPSQNYLWSNGVNSYTAPNVSTLSAGLWSATVTDALTGCTISDLFLIMQPLAQVITLTAGSPTACPGTGVVLTGTASGGTPGYSYSWSGPSSGNTATVSENMPGTYVYSITSVDNNSCQATGTISVDFIAPPTLSVGNVYICPLQTGTLTVSGASSYTWNNVTVGNTFTASPPASQQYTVVGSALGCNSTATAAIILKPVPVPAIGNNVPVCQNGNLQLYATAGAAYSWDGPQGFSAGTQNPLISSVTLNHSGVYNVTVTGVNSCTASISKTIMVNPTPTLSAAGSTVCTSQTLSLYASSAGSSFLWNGPNGFSSATQNPVLSNLVLASGGDYTVRVTSAAGCTNAAVAQASVVLPPSLSIALSGNGTLCAQALNGSPNTITLTSSGAASYTLTTPNHLYNTNPNGPVSPLTSVPPFQGTVTVATATLQGSNGICTAITTVSFSIIPNPTVALTPTPVICAGQSYTYHSAGANSFTWGPGSPGLNTYTGPVTVASPTLTSVYSVVGGSLGCNSGTQTSTITVFPLPLVSIAPQNPLICRGKNIDLVASGTGTFYQWSPPIGLSSVTGATVSAAPSQSQEYTVVASANNCTSQAMVTVTVLPLPVPVIALDDNRFCLNEEVTLKGTGGVRYAWAGPDGLKGYGPVFSFIANSLALTGEYTLTATDAKGCSASTGTVIEIDPLPAGKLTGPTEGCVPFQSDYKFSPINSIHITGNWVINNKSFTGNPFSYYFTQPGEYKIMGHLQDTVTQCRDSYTLFVQAYSPPVADFTWLPEKPVEEFDEVIFTNKSTGEDQTAWSWFINNGYSSNDENTSFLFKEAGNYPVALVVMTERGCSDTVVKSVFIEQDFTMYVPNAFTPNGDNVNDVFLPVIRSLKTYQLRIFDRWGQMVFSTSDILQGWDGTFNGQPCKQDVYSWKVVLDSDNGTVKEAAGGVLLFR